MAALIVGDELVVLVCGSSATCYSLRRKDSHTIDLQSSVADCTDKIKNPNKSFPSILSANLSPCGKLLALCDTNKQLSVWETDTWSCKYTFGMVKRAGKVAFAPCGDSVLVADKSGDVYSCTFHDGRNTLLLGHVSMLLDILITSDKNYLISCDRDEKIRVSKFPNSYNIVSYCLGHREFVTCLSLVPHFPSCLVSSSGDGTVKLWKFLSGTQLYDVDCRCDILQHAKVDGVTVQTEGKEEQEMDGASDCVVYQGFAVKNFNVCGYDERTSILCVHVNSFEGILCYKMSGQDCNISVTLLQVVQLPCEPLSTALSSDCTLWVLLPVKENPLRVFKLQKDGSKFVPLSISEDEIGRVVSAINSDWTFSEPPNTTNAISCLYKRKYDNVKEYKEKKKARMFTE